MLLQRTDKMDENIIPFGKHKGKPIEILASDKQYMDWLLGQSWFKERHINLYNIVINNFREPVDTPEHNKIQIKFLKHEYHVKLAFLVNPRLFGQNSKQINSAMLDLLDSKEKFVSDHFIDALTKPDAEREFGLYSRQLLKFSKPVFENVDVCFTLWYGINFFYNNSYHAGLSEFRQEVCSTYWIEIKPTISDDFPAVLRQMKASMPVEKSDWRRDRFFVLLVREYTGTSATKEEFVEYFNTQGYKVVFLDDLENLQLPDFEREFKLDPRIEERIKQHSR